MQVTEAVETRIELREYSDEPVAADTKRAILEAGRLAPSGRNLQHWRFIMTARRKTASLGAGGSRQSITRTMPNSRLTPPRQH